MRADPKQRLRPCEFCGTPTRLEIDQRGPRGALLGYAPACILCCEQPARRATKVAA